MSQGPTLHHPKLSSILFVSVPEELTPKMQALGLDPSLLLPLEAPGDVSEFKVDSLSWEMVLSAMIKILAYEPTFADAGYYRNFVMTISPGVLLELEQMGVAKAKDLEFDVAEECFRGLAGLQPNEPRHGVNLGLLYESRASRYLEIDNQELADEYLSKALESYQSVRQAHQDFAQAWRNEGLLHLREDRIDEAIPLLEAYLDLAPDGDDASQLRVNLEQVKDQLRGNDLFNDAYTRISEGDDEGGIRKISSFIDEHPDVWNAWFLLGWANRRLERYEEASEAFREADRLEPNRGETLNELAICAMEAGDLPASRTYLTNALSLEPDNVKVLSNLGIVALRQGDEGEAAAVFEKVLEISPDDPLAQEFLSRLRRGSGES